MDIKISPDGPPLESGFAGKAKLHLPPSCEPPYPGNQRKQLVWIVRLPPPPPLPGEDSRADHEQVFGGTGHMGQSLVKAALGHGDRVTTVGRTFESTAESMAKLTSSGCLGTLCDVRARESVERVVQATLKRFERVDVVANCSGYGVIGACEDQDEHDLRDQFETNVMGTMHIIQTCLPLFRQQGSGRFLIFSSTAGSLGVPGLGPYCATKYAVEGLVEAMLYELEPFNVKATLIEPGFVRREEPVAQVTTTTTTTTTEATPGVSSSSSSAAAVVAAGPPLPSWGHFLIKPPSEAYALATSPALHAKRMVQWLGDRQPTSAAKCAQLVWQLGHCHFPPLRLLLGSYAVESIRDRIRSVTEELEDWKHLHFPVAPDPAAADKDEKMTHRDDDTGDSASQADTTMPGVSY